MKIAFYNVTTTTKSGGIETFNWEMAKALARRGHTVHIYGGKGNFAFPCPKDIAVFTYPYVRRELFPDLGTRFRRFMERLSFGIVALRDLVRRRYDYLYVIKPYDIPIALLASSLSKVRVIFGSAGTEFFPGYRQLVKRLDHFFACSEFNASQIESYCGIRPAILPNGVDTNLFRPGSMDMELRRALRLKEGDAVVMTVGRLVGLKGIQYAIRAVDRLIKQGNEMKYLIIGEGEEREKLQRLVKTLQREDSIFLLGNIANASLPRYYSLAQCAVFPSIADEAFGIAIAEAMACGVPVISTTIGGIPEVVAEGTGLLVPSRDENALAEAMLSLLADQDLRKKYGSRGREWIESRFGWDGISRVLERYIGYAEEHA